MMKEDTIKELWRQICGLDNIKLSDSRLPLEHLDEYLRYFRLEPLQSGRKRFVKDSEIIKKDPSFKELNNEILLDLRYCLYTGESLDTAALWAEKLLRFCEVRLTSLRKRAIEKCASQREGQLLVLHLAAFLLDYGAHTDDLRYLNTVLKLADQKWILDSRTIPKLLHGSPDKVACGVFQFRVILVCEHVLERLGKGEAL
jgi:hypothetical protein